MNWSRTISRYSQSSPFGIRGCLHVHQRVQGGLRDDDPEMSDDAVKLRFIPFSFWDNAKKWLYSLDTNSIMIWAEFVAVFLKKFFPMHKMTRIRSEINQFRQLDKKPFWRYLDRFKDLLAQRPHHAIKKWSLYQIIYEGVDYQSKTLLESMSHEDFLRMTEDDAWKILEMAEKTMQWERFND